MMKLLMLNEILGNVEFMLNENMFYDKIEMREMDFEIGKKVIIEILEDMEEVENREEKIEFMKNFEM